MKTALKIFFRVLGLPFVAGLVLIALIRDYTWFLIRWLMYGGQAMAWSKDANNDDVRELIIELRKQNGKA